MVEEFLECDTEVNSYSSSQPYVRYPDDPFLPRRMVFPPPGPLGEACRYIAVLWGALSAPYPF